MSNPLRREIAAATGLADELLERLILELEALILAYRANKSSQLSNEAQRSVKSEAKRRERLAAALREVADSPAKRSMVGLGPREAQLAAMLAEAEAALSDGQRRACRPTDDARDWLAKRARAAIGQYCSVLLQANQNRAVAAVLEKAGAGYIRDLKNDPAKFERIFAAKFPKPHRNLPDDYEV